MNSVEDVPIEDRHHINKIIGYDCDENSYIRVPVESFGLGLLYEMGWYEGRGVGKNTENSIHHIIEVQPRNARQGLSAEQKPTDQYGNVKDDEKLEEMMIPKRHRNKTINSSVVIVKGIHKDLKGTILEISNKKTVLIELKDSQKNVKVDLSDIEEENEFEKINIQKSIESKKIKKKKEHEKKGKKLKWVTTGIKVRIISKKFSKGKYYNVKGEVCELNGSSFQVLVDNVFIEIPKEKYVETLIPVIESEVIFVKGDHKGKIGILKEKITKNETAYVQILDDFSVVSVDFNSISEKGSKFN